MSSIIIEQLRKGVIEQLFDTKTFSKSFNVWQKQIGEIVGANPTPDKILDLGSSMREIFTSTGTAGRDQAELSGGGAAWEALICWYLNLCLIGTNSVVIKKRSQVPVPIQDALTVSYRNVEANTESDIVCVTFPDDVHLHKPLLTKEKLSDRLNHVTSDRFGDIKVTVIQSKTNWNDNAQIPMLWDMVYHAEGFGDRRVTVGTNNHFLTNLNHFSYAFFTVPSNKIDLFKDSSLCVKRVSELSGGNYWGCESKKGVAKAPKEVFITSKIGPEDGKGVRSSLLNEIKELRKTYSYFNI